MTLTSDASPSVPEPSPSAPAASAAALPRDRKARAARVVEILDRIYPVVEIPLDHGDPFQLLVATILSAQCTDARVNMVTPALFARAPDAYRLASPADLRIVYARPATDGPAP